MDEIQLQDFIQKCKFLKNKFLGVFAAGNFPPHNANNAFMIVKTLKSDYPGTYWTLICHRKNFVKFADSLGLPLLKYTNIYQKVNENFNQVMELMRGAPMENSNSTCVVHFVFTLHIWFIVQTKMMMLLILYILKTVSLLLYLLIN